MANALYLVRIPAGLCGKTLHNKVNAVIVVADDASANANGRAAAKAAVGGPDNIWDDATVTALTAALGAPIPVTMVD
jgi:hypothetical protein